MKALTLQRDGAEIHQSAATSCLAKLEQIFAEQGNNPGRRILDLTELLPALRAEGEIGRIAAGYLGNNARPVRAVAFDKSPDLNWSLGWHQDRTICVRDRAQVAGYGPWGLKKGRHHVSPPIELLEQMITLRVHLDPVDETNAPLIVALGSHKLGFIPEKNVEKIVETARRYSCLANGGDI